MNTAEEEHGVEEHEKGNCCCQHISKKSLFAACAAVVVFLVYALLFSAAPNTPRLASSTTSKAAVAADNGPSQPQRAAKEGKLSTSVAAHSGKSRPNVYDTSAQRSLRAMFCPLFQPEILIESDENSDIAAALGTGRRLPQATLAEMNSRSRMPQGSICAAKRHHSSGDRVNAASNPPSDPYHVLLLLPPESAAWEEEGEEDGILECYACESREGEMRRSLLNGTHGPSCVHEDPSHDDGGSVDHAHTDVSTDVIDAKEQHVESLFDRQVALLAGAPSGTAVLANMLVTVVQPSTSSDSQRGGKAKRSGRRGTARRVEPRCCGDGGSEATKEGNGRMMGTIASRTAKENKKRFESVSIATLRYFSADQSPRVTLRVPNGKATITLLGNRGGAVENAESYANGLFEVVLSSSALGGANKKRMELSLPHAVFSLPTHRHGKESTTAHLFSVDNLRTLCHLETVVAGNSSEAVATYPFAESAKHWETGNALEALHSNQRPSVGLVAATKAKRRRNGGSSSSAAPFASIFVVASCRPPIRIPTAMGPSEGITHNTRPLAIAPHHRTSGGDMLMRGAVWGLDVLRALRRYLAPHGIFSSSAITGTRFLAGEVFVPYRAGVDVGAILSPVHAAITTTAADGYKTLQWGRPNAPQRDGRKGSKGNPAEGWRHLTNGERLDLFPFEDESATRSTEPSLSSCPGRKLRAATYVPCYINPTDAAGNRNSINTILRTIRSIAAHATVHFGSHESEKVSGGAVSPFAVRSDLVVSTNLPADRFMALLEEEVLVEQRFFLERCRNATDSDAQKLCRQPYDPFGPFARLLSPTHLFHDGLLSSAIGARGAPRRASASQSNSLKPSLPTPILQRFVYPAELGDLVIISFKAPTRTDPSDDNGGGEGADDDDTTPPRPTTLPTSSSSWLALAGYAHFPLISQLGFYDVATYSEDDVALRADQFAGWLSLLPLLEASPIDAHINFIRFEASWEELQRREGEEGEVLAAGLPNNEHNDSGGEGEEGSPHTGTRDPSSFSVAATETAVYMYEPRRLFGYNLFATPRAMPNAYVLSDLQRGVAHALAPIATDTDGGDGTARQSGGEVEFFVVGGGGSEGSGNAKAQHRFVENRRSFGVRLAEAKATTTGRGSALGGNNMVKTPQRVAVSEVCHAKEIGEVTSAGVDVILAPASHNGFRQRRIYCPLVVMPLARWQRFFFSDPDAIESKERESVGSGNDEEWPSGIFLASGGDKCSHPHHHRLFSRTDTFAGRNAHFAAASWRLPWNRPIAPLNTYREDLVYFSSSPLGTYRNGGIFGVAPSADDPHTCKRIAEMAKGTPPITTVNVGLRRSGAAFNIHPLFAINHGRNELMNMVVKPNNDGAKGPPHSRKHPDWAPAMPFSVPL